MFTGIIAQRGVVKNRIESDSDTRISFSVKGGFLNDCAIGDSIAVSGVCLTVVDLDANHFGADVSAETLARTTLSDWKDGRKVNLEPALRAADRLGGHLVSGHIDACAKLVSETREGGSRRMEFEYPQELARYVAGRGSVCIDGVSLTVNDVGENDQKHSWFCVNVIPHTLEVTTLGSLRTGDTVNLEVDMIARYLERLQAGA